MSRDPFIVAMNAAIVTFILVPVAIVFLLGLIRSIRPRLRPALDAFWEKFCSAKVYSLVFLTAVAVFSWSGWSLFSASSRQAPTAVRGPSASSPTAICADGTYSYSASRRGTCSHHGGVAQWLSR